MSEQPMSDEQVRRMIEEADEFCRQQRAEREVWRRERNEIFDIWRSMRTDAEDRTLDNSFPRTWADDPDWAVNRTIIFDKSAEFIADYVDPVLVPEQRMLRSRRADIIGAVIGTLLLVGAVVVMILGAFL